MHLYSHQACELDERILCEPTRPAFLVASVPFNNKCNRFWILQRPHYKQCSGLLIPQL